MGLLAAQPSTDYLLICLIDVVPFVIAKVVNYTVVDR